MELPAPHGIARFVLILFPPRWHFTTCRNAFEDHKTGKLLNVFIFTRNLKFSLCSSFNFDSSRTTRYVGGTGIKVKFCSRWIVQFK